MHGYTNAGAYELFMSYRTHVHSIASSASSKSGVFPMHITCVYIHGHCVVIDRLDKTSDMGLCPITGEVQHTFPTVVSK